MRFTLVDTVLERSDARIVTLKLVTAGEEYLADHFAGFPVLPGVFMLEAMVQAARVLEDAPRLVLAEARALRYARFVRPGEGLRVEVERTGDRAFRGTALVLTPGEPDAPLAASGRFALREPRTSA